MAVRWAVGNGSGICEERYLAKGKTGGESHTVKNKEVKIEGKKTKVRVDWEEPSKNSSGNVHVQWNKEKEFIDPKDIQGSLNKLHDPIKSDPVILAAIARAVTQINNFRL